MAKVQTNKGAMAVSHETIVQDMACRGCGYNLKGLQSGALCPECGEAITAGSLRGKRVVYDTSYLGDAPRGYLLVLRLGMFAAGMNGLVVLGLMLLAIVGLYGAATATLWLGAAILRLGGLAVTFRSKPKMEGSSAPGPSGKLMLLKLAALGSQAAIVIIPGLYFVSTAAYEALFIPLMIVGLVGAGLVAIVHSFTADWATDTPKANWLRACAWMLIAGPILGVMVWAAGVMGFPAMAYILWMQVLGMIGALFAFGLVSVTELLMVSMIGWAIVASDEKAARDARLLEKARKFNVREMPEASADGFALGNGGLLGGMSKTAGTQAEQWEPVSEPEAQPGQNMHRVERGEDVSPYGLEGESGKND